VNYTNIFIYILLAVCSFLFDLELLYLTRSNNPFRYYSIDSLSDSLEEVFFQPGITYYFIIRRLPLFYTAFLVSPCLGISFLTGKMILVQH